MSMLARPGECVQTLTILPFPDVVQEPGHESYLFRGRHVPRVLLLLVGSIVTRVSSPTLGAALLECATGDADAGVPS
jgi:hypothetical protein